MNIKTLTIACLLLAPATTTFGQKIKMTSGKMDALKGQKTINIVYDYGTMGVGKFDKEEDYVNKKVHELNEKEAGRGDKWSKDWVADRKNRFEPKFLELFNIHLAKSGLKGGDFADAPYTLILKTTFTEPGFNVGVVRKSAFTNLEAILIKTGTTDPIGVVTIDKSPGRDAMGYDFDTGLRIQESYAKAGKELAKYLSKTALR